MKTFTVVREVAVARPREHHDNARCQPRTTRMFLLITFALIVLALGVLEVVASQLPADRLGEFDARPAPTWFAR